MKCTFKSITSKVIKPGTVGALVEGFISIDFNIIPDGILKYITEYEGVKITPYDDGILVKSWATTTCSEKDEFNELTGKRIAESKAKLYIYRFMRNIFDAIANYHEYISDVFNDAYMKYDHCVEHELEHLAKLDNND